MEPSSSVRTNPGEIDVVRMTPSVDSWRSALHHGAHRVLRRRVDRHVGHDLQPGRRDRRDEVAAALAPEHRHRGGDPVQHSAQVDVDHRRPTVDVAVGDGADRADPRVGDQHVEPAELVDGGSDQPSRSSRRRDVGGPGDHRSAVGAQLPGESVESVGAASASTSDAARWRRAAGPSPPRCRCWRPVIAMTLPGLMPGSRLDVTRVHRRRTPDRRTDVTHSNRRTARPLRSGR